MNWLPAVDERAQAYLTDTISSNAVVFTVVRTLNGAISVVQSVEVGVGIASVHLGEILDPVNDLIERFSGLLLVTLTALGISQVLLLLTISLPLKIAFSVLGLVCVISLWREGWLSRLGLKIMVAALVLRFLLVVQLIAVWLFDTLYFNATGQKALSVLEGATQVLQNLRDSVTEFSLKDWLFGAQTATVTTGDVSQTITSSVVTLIVGMLFKSVLIPLSVFWVGFGVIKQVWKVNER